jgi:hypothetical protein
VQFGMNNRFAIPDFNKKCPLNRGVDLKRLLFALPIRAT